jgi:hypothetical protein
MFGQSPTDAQDIVEDIAGIKSSALLNILRLLIKNGGELDLIKSGLSPSERRQAMAQAASYDWIECGPEFAPCLLIKPDYFSTVAATVEAVPKQFKRSRTSKAKTAPIPEQSLLPILNGIADLGGLKVLAEVPEPERRQLIEHHDHPWSQGHYSIQMLRSCPLEESVKGPCVLLSLDFFAEPSALSFHCWAPASPHVLLASLSTAGWIRRHELPLKRDQSLKKTSRKKIEALLSGFDPVFPIPDTKLPLTILLSLGRSGICALKNGQWTVKRQPCLSNSDQCLQLLHSFATTLKLPDSHPDIAPICNHALRLLLSAPQAQTLTSALDRALLHWIHDQERFSAPRESPGHWSLMDLKAACWPRVGPLAHFLGLVDIALDHLKAPIALRPSDIALRTFARDAANGSLSMRSGALELSADLFTLAKAASIAPLFPARSFVQWKVPKRPGHIEELQELGQSLELDDSCKAWIKSFKSCMRARARNWFVLEVDKAETADKIAQSLILQRIILEQLTPTVFLLTSPASLTARVRAEFKRLDIILDLG